MSRISDTRQRTREAAAVLVASGKRPHELTVDLIYAAIQQGSRTTINDELKQWKEVRAKTDAQDAAFPPAVIEAMRTFWVTAVEHGERVFADHRQTLDTEMEALCQAQAAAVVERDAALAATQLLQQDLVHLREQHVNGQQQLARETEAKGDALGQVHALQQEITTVRADMAHQLDVARQAHERLTTEFQTTLAARDAAFQAERDKANERLEAAQTRMLQETDVAREGLRRAEQQLTRLRQRNEEQQSALAELRMEVARYRRELAGHEARLAVVANLTVERDQFALELATARGQITGLAAAVQSAEARAAAAEAQMATVRKRR